MIKDKLNILVTGCGGDIGQSIGKILNEYSLVHNLYGCDISDKNAAKFIYPNFFLGLKYNDLNYIDSLEKFVKENDIDFIIPISEPELRFFSKEKINKIDKAELILASDLALQIGFDKLETANFLKINNLPFPITESIEKVDLLKNFPVILKSRTGSGSSDVSIVHDFDTFLSLKRNNPDFIVQEFLDGDNGEYTCGLFRSKNGIIRTIIIKRELMGSQTGYGEVVDNSEIDNLLFKIAEKLSLVGSINVQLRLTSKGPVVFEINPRFSSTIRFRHLFGFKDMEWSIEDKLNIPISNYSANSIGKKLYKGFSEYIE
ncbi:ATP-dependent carboxylate-amine ligase [Flavobacterium aquariorum]|uniref:ATP-dependent carboxylate-amine ligase n=1 Tax=Flavobacterium aquariorum TaxID=2217670 RepID=A0A2W7VJM9_9FLAO|nr:ATP-grasp domain-containing protein [Flavobacterium aquariorum]PZX92492.1 ATP-dependent carboxylate-amine ligase [Flavobacterium aquariorum]